MIDILISIGLIVGFILVIVGLLIEKETLSIVGYGLIFVAFLAGLMLGYTVDNSIDSGSFTLGYWFYKMLH